MLKSIAAQSVTTIAATALLAATLVTGLAMFLTSVVPEAKAESQANGKVHQPHAKADPLPALVTGAACSRSGWPNYEQSCQFDVRRPANEARTVRIIALR
jgi:hypothetical protein